MNLDVAKKWVEELRSTQCGQTVGVLRETVEDCPLPAFCVMGVLCDLFLRECGGQWRRRFSRNPDTGEETNENWVVCDGWHSVAPPQVLKWAGFVGDGINIYDVLSDDAKDECSDNACYVDFVDANDQYGLTFVQFAELIEKQAEQL